MHKDVYHSVTERIIADLEQGVRPWQRPWHNPAGHGFVSRSDPAAQWTGAPKGHAFFAYATNYLIDLEHAVIVDVEASRAIRQAEVGSARTMLDRAQERFGLWPARLAADSAYAARRHDGRIGDRCYR